MPIIFNPNRFTILEFFSYPCCVVERTAEYEDNGWHRTTCGDKYVKEFFDAVLAKAREITGKHLMDNKIAFKIYDNETDSTFYVGYKDNIWAIGPHLNPYMNSCYTLPIEIVKK